MKKLLFKVLIFCIVFLFISCDRSYTPKPRGYFRIEFPEKKYQEFNTDFPYKFQYPVYSTVETENFSPNEKYWMNINFKEFKAKVHLSYKSINKNQKLNTLIEDARTLALKHIPKASGIEYIDVDGKNQSVYGTIYKINGSQVASPFQFYVTDSVNNFLRGALYFETYPNNDSLMPVIKFVEDDIVNIIQTLEWK